MWHAVLSEKARGKLPILQAAPEDWQKPIARDSEGSEEAAADDSDSFAEGGLHDGDCTKQNNRGEQVPMEGMAGTAVYNPCIGRTTDSIRATSPITATAADDPPRTNNTPSHTVPGPPFPSRANALGPSPTRRTPEASEG